jgi:transposase-like protein
VKKFTLGHIDTVNGVCPHCDEEAILVAVVTDYYRCTNCGEDTRQFINGSIKYLKLDNVDKEWLKNQQLDK